MKNIYKNIGIIFILTLFATMAFTQQNMLADIPNQDPNNPVYAYVEKMPVLTGGLEMLKLYVDFYPYPSCGLENKIEGKIILQFIVEKNGDLSDIKVVRGTDECLSKAAIDYLKQWPKWEPAQVNDKPVRCLFTLPIDYNINQYNTRPK